MAVANGFGQVVTSGSVFMYDTGDTVNSYKGEPTTNYIPNADIMSSWTTYYRTLALSTFTTEFGTTGYRFVNQPSWNGIYRNFTLPTTGTYTFSAWFRYNGGSANNNGATVYIHNYGGGDTAAGLNKNLIGVWQRVSHTITVSSPSNVYFFLISYGGVDNGTGNPDYSSWEVTMPQIELKSHVTPFVNGTRSATQGLLPVVGNSTIDLSNVSFDSNAQMVFDGTDDKIDIAYYSPVNNSMSRSWEVVIKPTSTMTYSGIFGNKLGYGCSYYCNGGIYLWDGNWVFNWYDNSNYQFLYSGVAPTANQYFHIVGTYDATDQKPRIYINGELKATYGSTTNMDYGSQTYVIDIGWNSKDGGQHYFQGEIPITKYYQNKALSAAEVKQNYNKYKTRFNLT